MEVMCRLLAERYGCWARITSNLDFPRRAQFSHDTPTSEA